LEQLPQVARGGPPGIDDRRRVLVPFESGPQLVQLGAAEDETRGGIGLEPVEPGVQALMVLLVEEDDAVRDLAQRSWLSKIRAARVPLVASSRKGASPDRAARPPGDAAAGGTSGRAHTVTQGITARVAPMHPFVLPGYFKSDTSTDQNDEDDWRLSGGYAKPYPNMQPFGCDNLPSMPTSTVEDYLKCILLEQQRDLEALVPMRQISAALRVAPGTVTSMMKVLSDSGLVVYEPYSGVRLADAGLQLAVRVLPRHRLIELFLIEVLGLSWIEVHSEAEELEHVVSDRFIERIDDLLGHPSVDPHGFPIPTIDGVFEDVSLPSLLDCEINTLLKVARVNDQSRDFLQLLDEKSLKPGAFLTVENREDAADAVELRLQSGEALSLGFRAASKLFVEPRREPTG
jgi:DtxR family transcriptional regulator, Mn-dependent transcriptional regulator